MPALFFLIALLYSMAGFGGGSSYLALLSLTDRPLDEIATLALICNLAATLVGCYHFAKDRLIHWSQAAPFLVGSIPAAFIGGSIRIPPGLHLLLLALSLSVAGVYLLAGVQQEAHRPTCDWSQRTRWPAGLMIGAGLGVLAGLIGMGGGIFLAPLLYALRWTTARHIAGLACCFICCNSIAGLAGRSVRMGYLLCSSEAFWLLISVLAGAFIGSRLASRKLVPSKLRFITAVLVTIVAVRLWLRWLAL